MLNNTKFKARNELNSYDGKMPISSRILKILMMLVKAAMIAILLVAICTYIYFCPPVLTKLNGGFILFPIPPGEEYKYDTINGVKRQEAYFQNKIGNKLHGWFFKSTKADAPVVLISHGNAGNIGHRLLLVQHLLEAGASVFVYDYREFGKSEGKKNLDGLTDDADAAFAYLTNELKIPSKQIVLYGESIGGGPTCALAKQHDVAGIILDSTFTSLLQIGKKKIQYFNVYPDFLQPIPSFDNIGTLRGAHAPVLIMHGQLDEIIPLSEARENFAGAAEPKTMIVLPNSSHNDKGADFQLYQDSIAKFLSTLKVQS